MGDWDRLLVKLPAHAMPPLAGICPTIMATMEPDSSELELVEVGMDDLGDFDAFAT